MHERGALCEPGLLSCLAILLLCHRPRWGSTRGPAHVCTRVNIAAIIIAAAESNLADVTGRVDEHESAQLETTKSRFQQQPIRLEIMCPYCQNSIIGKIVTCELEYPEKYLEGLVSITTYICVGCQTVIDQKVRDFSL